MGIGNKDIQTIAEVIAISSSDEDEEMYISSSDEDEEMDIPSSDEEMNIPPKATTSKPCTRGEEEGKGFHIWGKYGEKACQLHIFHFQNCWPPCS